MTTTQYYVHELGSFLGLLPSYIFMFGCYFLWMQTHKISNGHRYIGQFCVLMLFIFDVIFTLAPEYAHTIRPFMNMGISTWVIYNGWYFYRFPIPVEYLRATRPLILIKPVFTPKSRLGVYLTQPGTGQAVWFSGWFRATVAIALLLIMGAYFIQRLANLAVASDRRVIEETTKAAKVVQSVKAEVKTDLKQLADTLAQGQKRIVQSQAETKLDLRNSNSAIEAKLNKTNQAVDRKLNRLGQSVERSRHSLVIPVTSLQPKPPTGTLLSPDRVKPLPVAKKKRLFGYEPTDDDTTHYYVRYDR